MKSWVRLQSGAQMSLSLSGWRLEFCRAYVGGGLLLNDLLSDLALSTGVAGSWFPVFGSK